MPVAIELPRAIRHNDRITIGDHSWHILRKAGEWRAYRDGVGHVICSQTIGGLRKRLASLAPQVVS